MARFSIDVRFKGGLSASQQAAFRGAADRWAQVVSGEFPRVRIDGEVIEALVIEASGRKIDRGGGPEGNILGQSLPTHVLPNGLPAKGLMEFDAFDLGGMEADGSLASVILHEMGHVLGIGSIWEDKAVLVGAGTANPQFVGKKADKEWAKLSKLPADQLPVENHGGPGTEDSHWRETVFGNELMTGFISGTRQPLSRMTIASLADLGYKVSLTRADKYALPSHLQVRAMGIGASPERMRRCTLSGKPKRRTEPRRLPPEALV